MAARQLRSLPMPAALTRPIIWMGTRREYLILEWGCAGGALIGSRFHWSSFVLAAFTALVAHPLLVAATKWDPDFLHVVFHHFELNSSLLDLVTGSPRAFFFPARADYATAPPKAVVPFNHGLY